MSILSVRNLNKSFGAISVSRNLSFELAKGEALGIIGPNGAGKSSTFNLIGGNLRPDSGSIFFGGDDITRRPPEQRCRRGIGRTYQIPQPFGGMTVFENLLVCASSGSRERFDYDAHCAQVLARTGLLRRANVPARTLTLLERKRLELARALAGKPSLLLLDEIAGGLTDAEARELVGTIRAIHEAGTAIVWIEHVVHALLAVVTRLMVINFGEKLTEGEPAAVMRSPDVRRIYMGIEVSGEMQGVAP